MRDYGVTCARVEKESGVMRLWGLGSGLGVLVWVWGLGRLVEVFGCMVCGKGLGFRV